MMPSKLTAIFFIFAITVSFSIMSSPPDVTYTDDTDEGDQTDDSCHIGVDVSGAEVEGDNVLIYWDGSETGIPFDECVVIDADAGSLRCTSDIPVSDGEHTFEVCATERWGLERCADEQRVDFGDSSDVVYSLSTGGSSGGSTTGGSNWCWLGILILALLFIFGSKRSDCRCFIDDGTRVFKSSL